MLAYMRSYPVSKMSSCSAVSPGLRLFSTLCRQTLKAIAKLHTLPGSSKRSLVAYTISMYKNLLSLNLCMLNNALCILSSAGFCLKHP